MGARGPVPKRAAQRLGHRTKAENASTVIPAAGAVSVPEVDPLWHTLAADWYRSLGESAQAKLLEPSDWAAARIVASELTRMLAEAPNAALLGKLWSAMGELMTTEGARRRLKVEIERKALSAVPASVTKIDDFRDL